MSDQKSSVVNPFQKEDFSFTAALYFLGEQGHYLFRYQKDGALNSKYIRHRDVVAAFQGVEEDSGFINPGVIRIGANKGGDWFLYYAKACVKDVPFILGDEAKTLRVPIPPTLVFGTHNKVAIYAVKENTFNPEAKLFRAPFPNVSPDGAICWGSERCPKTHHSNAQEIWELFFSSAFNDHLSQAKLKGIGDSCLPFWVSLAEKGSKKFPIGKLIRAYGTVDKLIR